MTTPTLSVGTLAPPAPGAVRLTARGRALLLLVLMLGTVLAVVVSVIGPGTAAPPTAVASSAPAGPDAWGAELAQRGLATAHTVAAGDTLWDLATAIDPAGDPRPLIDRIQLMNGMSDGRLTVGDRLWLPVLGG
jgi:hypothetical protein